MKPAYIQSVSSISRADVFGARHFVNDLMGAIPESDGLVEPDYKRYIKGPTLRRTPKINRMALACAAECFGDAGHKNIEGIVVGSALGCLKDTEKFIQTSLTTEAGKMIPPTSFIQSGHNAISGQIALTYQNHDYNMTHVQGGLSFEHALLDAMLLIAEEKENVLLGGLDEKIELLEDLANRFGWEKSLIDQISEGCSFFQLSSSKTDSCIAIRDVGLSYADWQEELNAFLHRNQISEKHISKVFFGTAWPGQTAPELSIPSFDYSQISGKYLTNSAFGLHCAFDYLQSGDKPGYALVLNIAGDNEFGYILLGHE